MNFLPVNGRRTPTPLASTDDDASDSTAKIMAQNMCFRPLSRFAVISSRALRATAAATDPISSPALCETENFPLTFPSRPSPSFLAVPPTPTVRASRLCAPFPSDSARHFFSLPTFPVSGCLVSREGQPSVSLTVPWLVCCTSSRACPRAR